MGSADPQPAVAHGDDHLEVRPGELEPHRVGQSPAVEAMEGMGVEKGVEQARAADVADQGHVRPGQPQGNQGPVEGVDHPLMGAPRTENRRPVSVEQASHECIALIRHRLSFVPNRFVSIQASVQFFRAKSSTRPNSRILLVTSVRP